MKKRLEVDVGDLDTALDHANQANVENQKSIKKLQENIRQTQVQGRIYLIIPADVGTVSCILNHSCGLRN